MTVGDLPPMAATTNAFRQGVSPVEQRLGGGLRFVRSRRGLMLTAAVVIAGGAALNWSWLVAVGAAPILLAVLPCLAMCGLGLCMKGSGKATGASCCGDKRQASVKPPPSLGNAG